MERIIRFKRNWEEGFIRVCVVEGDKVEIDAPLSVFRKRWLDLIELPFLMFCGRKQARRLVKQATEEAFEKAIYELKEETKRV
jgi:hypothetical protein